MLSVEASCQHLYQDFQDLGKTVLGNDVDHNNKNNGSKNLSRILLCPRLIVNIFSVPIRALIDTGSQITAISEECYNYFLSHGKFCELPVSNVELFTAVGKKSTVIKKTNLARYHCR